MTAMTEGITDSVGSARDSFSLGEEMIIWLLFSVITSLLYFGLALLVWWLVQRKVDFVELLKTGGLVTYAFTLASRNAGEYFKTVSGKTLMTPFCAFGLICILASTAGVYGMLLSLGASGSEQQSTGLTISAPRLAEFSWIVAAAAVVYGFSFTIYAKRRVQKS
jgi:hypothetical protein